ncbi:MAG: succinate dehydrogenase cytochrome b subunit [Pseudomonadota bacterium]
MIIARFFRSSIGRKTVMAASGAFLSLFLIVHGLGNATVFFGREAFLSYASKLHSLGILIHFFEFFLLAVFLLHIGTGLTLFIENMNARPVRYQITKSSGGRTPGSRFMPYSGFVILIFLVVHLINFHFIDHSVSIADVVRDIFSIPIYAFFYIAALAVLFFHISHGFWSFLQSFGVNHPVYDASIRKGALVIAFLLSAIFIFIPLCTLLLENFLL